MEAVKMQEEVAVAKSAQSVETAPPKVVMSLKDVAVTFNGRTAVRDATFDVSSNKITSLIGPSGSGKTTLLRALNRLHDLTKGAVVSGEIKLGDVDVYHGSLPTTLLRSRIGMVFQRPNPFPTMSIYDNAVSGLRFNGIRKKAFEGPRGHPVRRRATTTVHRARPRRGA
jgi:ABC-type phosphate transport system ATPase subunit